MPETTKGTKDHEGLWLQVFPSCTLVPLVVHDFANCTTTRKVPKDPLSLSRSGRHRTAFALVPAAKGLYGIPASFFKRAAIAARLAAASDVHSVRIVSTS